MADEKTGINIGLSLRILGIVITILVLAVGYGKWKGQKDIVVEANTTALTDYETRLRAVEMNSAVKDTVVARIDSNVSGLRADFKQLSADFSDLKHALGAGKTLRSPVCWSDDTDEVMLSHPGTPERGR